MLDHNFRKSTNDFVVFRQMFIKLFTNYTKRQFVTNTTDQISDDNETIMTGMIVVYRNNVVRS